MILNNALIYCITRVSAYLQDRARHDMQMWGDRRHSNTKSSGARRRRAASKSIDQRRIRGLEYVFIVFISVGASTTPAPASLRLLPACPPLRRGRA